MHQVRGWYNRNLTENEKYYSKDMDSKQITYNDDNRLWSKYIARIH